MIALITLLVLLGIFLASREAGIGLGIVAILVLVAISQYGNVNIFVF